MNSVNIAQGLIYAQNVSKNFGTESQPLPILKNISLQIKSGDSVCIVGPSGAGKSTLLQILGTLDRPSSGSLFFEGMDVLKFDDEKLSRFRNLTMGFVFQFHHLIPEFNAIENVMLPARISGVSVNEARARALELLGQLGLSHRVDHYSHQLSGGELQRVAIARALIQKPRVLFADEPTGNLDSANSQNIQNLFFQLKESLGLTLIVVTHDAQFAKKFSKVLKMTDGQF